MFRSFSGLLFSWEFSLRFGSELMCLPENTCQRFGLMVVWVNEYVSLKRRTKNTNKNISHKCNECSVILGQDQWGYAREDFPCYGKRTKPISYVKLKVITNPENPWIFSCEFVILGNYPGTINANGESRHINAKSYAGT